MRIVLLNQCFHPDHVATAQYLRDLARGLVARGHQVEVICSNRGYDHPEKQFPLNEWWEGIHIRRVAVAGFGKSNMWRRLLDALSFWFNASSKLFFAEKPDVIVSLTSPPLISFLGALAAKWHGCRSAIWLMDMNPDQAIINGVIRKGSILERTLTRLMNWSYKQAALIVALDRYMAKRLRAKEVDEQTILICAPWPQDHELVWQPQGRAEFRREHGLENKFVVMYSGNHSPCHPLDVVLEAALRLKDVNDLVFLFVGAGSEQKKAQAFAEKHQLSAIRCLPYQPQNRLAASLSSADLHLVVMGDPYVGIVHPCKIYNVMSLGMPFLFIGPESSHGADIVNDLKQPHLAKIANHHDVEQVVQHLRDAMANGQAEPAESISHHCVQFSINHLLPLFCSRIEELYPEPHVAI